MLSKQNFQVEKEHEAAVRSDGEGADLSTATDALHSRGPQLSSRPAALAKIGPVNQFSLCHLAWSGEKICRYLFGEFKVFPCND